MRDEPSDDELEAMGARGPGMSTKSKLALAAVIAIVIAVAFGPRMLRGIEEDAIAESGTPAPAVVVSLEQTGNISNDVHELRITVEVRPADGAPYEAGTRKFVKPHQLPQVQPGSELEVKYDPEDRKRIAIVKPELQ